MKGYTSIFSWSHQLALYLFPPLFLKLPFSFVSPTFFCRWAQQRCCGAVTGAKKGVEGSSVVISKICYTFLWSPTRSWFVIIFSSCHLEVEGWRDMKRSLCFGQGPKASIALRAVGRWGDATWLCRTLREGNPGTSRPGGKNRQRVVVWMNFPNISDHLEKIFGSDLRSLSQFKSGE